MSTRQNFNFGCNLILIYILNLSVLHSQENPAVYLNNDIIMIESEGVAFLGSGISEDLAKTLAIKDAKRNALEQAGTYLEAHTTVLNYQLLKDEIITFTGGLVKTDIINEKRTIVDNMFAFKVYIKASIDANLLNERIAEIRRDSKLRKQIESQRQIIENLENKINELQTSNNSKDSIEKLTNELTIQEYFEKGFYAKDPNVILESFIKVIELEPGTINTYDAYLHKANAYSMLSKFEDAINECNNAISLFPRMAKAYRKRANVYFNFGNYNSAIKDYLTAIENIDEYPDINSDWTLYGKMFIYHDLHDVYAHLKEFSKAVETMNTAIKQTLVGVIDSELYLKRGDDYLQLGKYNLAISDYCQAIGLDSVSISNAEENKDKLLFIKPMQERYAEFAIDYYKRGLAFFKYGKYDLAVKDFTNAIRYDPQDAKYFLLRGNSYSQLSDVQAAVNDYNTYLKINVNAKHADKVRDWIRNLGYSPKY